MVVKVAAVVTTVDGYGKERVRVMEEEVGVEEGVGVSDRGRFGVAVGGSG